LVTVAVIDQGVRVIRPAKNVHLLVSYLPAQSLASHGKRLPDEMHTVTARDVAFLRDHRPGVLAGLVGNNNALPPAGDLPDPFRIAARGRTRSP